MNKAPSAREVMVEVLPPLPVGTGVSGAPPVVVAPVPLSSWSGFFHPASGVIIIAVDLLGFGPEMLSGFLAVPLVCALSFSVTLPLVFLVQWRWSRNSVPAAFGKALLGAVAAGLPFSITGTLIGAAILALSGLPGNPREAFKQVAGQIRR